MSYIELFLLALGLCFDTFAVSLTGGICLNVKLKSKEILKIIVCFAFFQTGFTSLGLILGYSVSSFIESFDHWIAFALLLYIGGKMVFESISKDDLCDNQTKVNLLDNKRLVILSIATSIDALAVGLSLAMIRLPLTKVEVVLAMIFAITAIASLVGLFGGFKLGNRFGKRSELVGGLILIAIGVKILIEHLAF